MSFYTSLSGLNAAQTDLNVTSNNIANAGTTGFKSSRAEFSDLISGSAFQAAGTIVGQGTRLKSISQEFSQGSVESTSRSLDLMVSGQGFFVTKASGTGGQVTFTRNGSFSVNGSNDVVDAAGNPLQVLPVDPLGNATATGLSAMQNLYVPPTNGSPKATSAISLSMTFSTDAAVPADTTFSTTDPNSYNNATSTTVYDSAGNAIPATVYYVHTQTLGTDSTGNKTGTSTWVAHTFIGDQEVFPSGTSTAPTLTFDTNGTLTSPSGPVTYGTVTPTGAAAPLTIGFDYGTATKEGSYSFATTASTQNGNTTGKLTDLAVDASGLVSASYSNGQTVALGKVAIANFANPGGLHQAGNTSWTVTAASGAPQIGEVGVDGSSTIQSGELEMSNVDLTAELVNLISAQRNFQANAKAIDTDKQMLSSIINLQ